MYSQSSPDEKGFFGSLFDLDFTSFVTTKVIRVLYVVALVLISLGAIVLFISGLASGRASGFLFALIFVPLGYVLYLTLTRIWMEFLVVVFRIGDDIHAIRTSGGFGPGRAAPGAPPPGYPPSGYPPAGGPPPGGPVAGPGGAPPDRPTPPPPTWPRR